MQKAAKNAKAAKDFLFQNSVQGLLGAVFRTKVS